MSDVPKRSSLVGSGAAGLLVAALSAHQSGQIDEALDLYQQCIAVDSQHVDAHHGIATCCAQKQQFEEAQEWVDRTLTLAPDHFPSLVLGAQLWLESQPAVARDLALRATQAAPQESIAWTLLGHVERRSGAEEAAVAAYETAIEQTPAVGAPYAGIAQVHLDRHHFQDAIDVLERGVATAAGDFSLWATLGTAHHLRGDHKASIAAYQKALRIQPLLPELHSNLGLVFREAGRAKEAVQSFRQALRLEPNHTDVRFMLGWARRHERRDAEVQWIERCAADPAAHGADPGEAWFLMAKILTELGQDTESFAWTDRANAARRAQIEFDIETERARFTTLRRSQDRNAISTAAGEVGLEDPTPVFVVGMPRSGTTLVEQILASHPQVFGADELDDLPSLLADLERVHGATARRVLQADPKHTRAAAAEYLSRLKDHAPDAARVVDKLPMNFLNLGVIRAWFPKAKVIHCVRNAADTCASIYRKSFQGLVPFAYDQREVAQYYGLYRDLMGHWRDQLEDDFLLDLPYEALVDDLEGMSRRLVDFVGLPWEAQCLSFHETERTVRTLSQGQVRQPIFRSSIGRWHRHESGLQVLLETLRQNGSLA